MPTSLLRKGTSSSLSALALIALALGLLVGSAASAQTVRLAKEIDFAKDSTAREKVRNECKLQTKVPHFVNEYAKDGAVQLVDGDPGKKGRVLTIEITSVTAPGGGGMSGSKYMQVRGTLRQDGKKVASFTGGRYSTGGFLGGYKGTCAILGRCAKAIGKDVAKWLENPEDGALLGDG